MINTHIKKAVIHEVKMLRQHATEDEINRLNFHMLDGTKSYDCIYGQLTGNCYSQRAIELINECVYKRRFYSSTAILNYDFTVKEARVMKQNSSIYYERYGAYTSLEVFIVLYPKYNKSIIDALEGKIQPEQIFQ